MSNTSPSWSTARHRHPVAGDLHHHLVARRRDGRDRARERSSVSGPEVSIRRRIEYYQEALRELIEAKMKGLTVKPREMAAPPSSH